MKQKFDNKLKIVQYFRVETDLSKNTDILKKELFECVKLKFEDCNPYYEQRQLVLKNGITNFIKPRNSEFLGTPKDDKEEFVKTFQNFLDNINIENNLFIIDSYIFPNSYDSDYPSLIIDILKKYIPQLQKITFITNKHYNRTLQDEIFRKIESINDGISLNIKNTDLFHDRFWLSSSNNKGAFIGTSLNGIGKKFTLIDYIKNDDVIKIFYELKNLF